MEAVADALKDAERPLIVLGPASNASRSGDLLGRLTDATNAPVIPMESPRGLNDPSLGQISKSFAQADLILSLGKSIDFTLNFGKPPAVDPAQPPKTIRATSRARDKSDHLSKSSVTKPVVVTTETT